MIEDDDDELNWVGDTFEEWCPTHVYPIEDLRPHVFHEKCMCQPEIRQNGMLIIHHAFDGREMFEGLSVN